MRPNCVRKKKKKGSANGSIHQLDGIWTMWCGKHRPNCVRVRIEYVRLEGMWRDFIALLIEAKQKGSAKLPRGLVLAYTPTVKGDVT